ncbi:MAG: hypothetical protein ACKO7B_17715 [Flavobacteriales bacterium]
MKKAICLYMIALTCSAIAWAQPGPPPAPGGEKRKEKVEALKRSYYSEKLALTPSEAEKFWPIYNEFRKKEETLRKEGKGDKKKGEEPKYNEKEALAEIDRVAQQKKAHIDLETQFLKDCMPVLGPERVMHLERIDREFQRELLQHMKEKEEGGKGPRK